MLLPCIEKPNNMSNSHELNLGSSRTTTTRNSPDVFQPGNSWILNILIQMIHLFPPDGSYSSINWFMFSSQLIHFLRTDDLIDNSLIFAKILIVPNYSMFPRKRVRTVSWCHSGKCFWEGLLKHRSIPTRTFLFRSDGSYQPKKQIIADWRE